MAAPVAAAAGEVLAVSGNQIWLLLILVWAALEKHLHQTVLLMHKAELAMEFLLSLSTEQPTRVMVVVVADMIVGLVVSTGVVVAAEQLYW
jgi:hypothetical protein